MLDNKNKVFWIKLINYFSRVNICAFQMVVVLYKHLYSKSYSLCKLNWTSMFFIILNWYGLEVFKFPFTNSIYSKWCCTASYIFYLFLWVCWCMFLCLYLKCINIIKKWKCCVMTRNRRGSSLELEWNYTIFL